MLNKNVLYIPKTFCSAFNQRNVYHIKTGIYMHVRVYNLLTNNYRKEANLRSKKVGNVEEKAGT